MLLANLLFSVFASIAPGDSVYRAIVVDAVSRRPLQSVTVQNLLNNESVATNLQGIFSFNTTHVRVHLSHVGYSPLEVIRYYKENITTDTLRMLPLSVTLPEVQINPAPEIVLSLAEKKADIKSRGLPPGNQLAVLHRPPDTLRTYQLVKIVVHLSKPSPVSGRLRVRLAPLASSGLPASTDYLPYSFVYSAQQLKDAGKLLTIDVSDYRIVLPGTGLCIIAEGLPDTDVEKFVGTSRGKNDVYIITGTDEKNPSTYRQTSISNFLKLEASFTPTNYQTWEKLNENDSWKARSGNSSNYSSKAALPTYNALLDAVVIPR